VKIAWVTPFSRRSAIGQYSAVIVERLRTLADVTVFASDVSPGSESKSWLPDADVHGILQMPLEGLLEVLDDFTLQVYNLGNYLAFHRVIYELALARPGIAVLHDVVMYHFFIGYYLQYRKDPTGYLDEVMFSHGAVVRADASAMLAGDARRIIPDQLLPRFNMAKSAIHRSDGVIVHSEFARRSVAPVAEGPVIHIPFPTPRIASAAPSSRLLRRRHADGKLRLLTLGMVNRNKLIAEVVAVLAASPYLRGQVVYHVIGSCDDSVYAQQVQQDIEDLGLEDVVFLLGHRPEKELQTYLARADLVINLRNPHLGEASWSLLEASFAGKPSVVWKHGFYDEFPDDAVAKVSSLEELGPKIEKLCRDAKARQALGERVRSFAERTFSTEQYCDRFLAFAQRTQYNRPVLRLTDTAAAMLAELGQSAKSPAADLLAAEISALGANDERVTARSMGIRHGT
jgi:glycosyltransferase involved in cell wall biosynthesis